MCVTRGSHSFTCQAATHTRTISAFTPQSQGVIILWLILSVPTHARPPPYVLIYCKLSQKHIVSYSAVVG